MFKRGGETPKNDKNKTAAESHGTMGESNESTAVNADCGESSGDTENMIESPGEEKINDLEAELKQSQDQAEEYFTHLQRLQADFDNYRKRTQKEKEDTIRYATERIVETMLPILDNFERAISSSQSNQDFQAFSQGVEMIAKQMQTALAKEGLKAIEAVGQPFDPNLHDAVLQIESEEHPENMVIEELQKGYYLKEKVLRPSMVKVSC